MGEGERMPGGTGDAGAAPGGGGVTAMGPALAGGPAQVPCDTVCAAAPPIVAARTSAASTPARIISTARG
ncbi:hypothetical protein [Massilia orientalis]|uniref:Uncharacterized protein n=1 Tax=Massilia orientalis TaxID=3050128 RepID=A0ACC7M3N4_9BURK|nr:hypothetical protein [Massilia sp. YIM B02787]